MLKISIDIEKRKGENLYSWGRGVLVWSLFSKTAQRIFPIFVVEEELIASYHLVSISIKIHISVASNGRGIFLWFLPLAMFSCFWPSDSKNHAFCKFLLQLLKWYTIFLISKEALDFPSKYMVIEFCFTEFRS